MPPGFDRNGVPNLITVPRLAELLGVSKHTVRYWLKRNVIPGEKMGHHWYIPASELETRCNGLYRQVVAANMCTDVH